MTKEYRNQPKNPCSVRSRLRSIDKIHQSEHCYFKYVLHIFLIKEECLHNSSPVAFQQRFRIKIKFPGLTANVLILWEHKKGNLMKQKS